MAQRGHAALWQTIALAVAVRAALVAYGEWQDLRMDVKYTDVDYWVFTDAAAALAAGRSPYARATYRYTPLLAALLVPGALLPGPWGRALWGKALFCAADIAAGVLIYAVLRLRLSDRARAARLTAAFWLLNPMVFAISTRGNAEALLAVLVLGFLYALLTGRVLASGALLGAAVHLKIFPAIYAPAVLAFLLGGRVRAPASPGAAPGALSPAASMAASATSVAAPSPLRHRVDADRAESVAHGRACTLPLGARLLAVLRFALGGLFGLGVPTALALWMCGREYVEHALVYHVVRRDHRHNFSPYFYVFYAGASARASLALPAWLLNAVPAALAAHARGAVRAVDALLARLPDPTAMPRAELAVFVPQALLLAAVGLKYGARDLPLALFLATFVFVALNKVVTSQYFVWYIALLPPAFVSLPRMPARRWLALAAVWGGAQALWLAIAYRVEFLGRALFLPLWAASLLFLVANVWIAGEIIRHRGPLRPALNAAPPVFRSPSASSLRSRPF